MKKVNMIVVSSFAAFFLVFILSGCNGISSSKEINEDTISLAKKKSEEEIKQIKKKLTDDHCRKLAYEMLKEKFNIKPDFIIVESKQAKKDSSLIIYSCLTEWTYKKDTSPKAFNFSLWVNGDSLEKWEINNLRVERLGNGGVDDLKIIYKIIDGEEIEMYMNIGDEIYIDGIKVKLVEQHYPLQAFETSQKLSKNQCQKVWTHEDRDPAFNMLNFRLPGKDRYTNYISMQERVLYVNADNPSNDQVYDINKDGDNWKFTRVKF